MDNSFQHTFNIELWVQCLSLPPVSSLLICFLYCIEIFCEYTLISDNDTKKNIWNKQADVEYLKRYFPCKMAFEASAAITVYSVIWWPLKTLFFTPNLIIETSNERSKIATNLSWCNEDSGEGNLIRSDLGHKCQQWMEGKSLNTLAALLSSMTY